MADGWTGLDVNTVKAQLRTFDEEMNKIISTYSDAFELFNNDLYVTWGSEKAVQFNKNLGSFSTYKSDFCEIRNKILNAAVSAAKFMAQHNGTTFDYSVAFMGTSTDVKELKNEINGVIGMNIPLAKLALETFTSTCNQIITDLDNLPIDFALYDPSGDMQKAYKDLVLNRTQNLSTALNDANVILQNAFAEETMQLEVGVVEAEEELTVRPTANEQWQEVGKKYENDWNISLTPEEQYKVLYPDLDKGIDSHWIGLDHPEWFNKNNN